MADRGSAAHAKHDLELVEGCADCAALAPDLAAISASLATLRGGVDSGHRDFRLTRADAQRLQRGRGLRSWLRPLAGPRFGFAQPLGSLLTVIALVGVIASSLAAPIGQGVGFEAASQPTDAAARESVVPAANPEVSPSALAGGLGSPTAKADSATDAAFGPLTSPPREQTSTVGLTPASSSTTTRSAAAPTTDERDATGTPSGIFLASLVLLPIGLLLVFGRGLARRLIGAAREP